ncbi:uncharacterized protein LOC124309028 [Neodiprion virginianus]|uniref:uncharacterized protein LOC124309028 n=1 Tax=Neodiprion virginianus TaxID=2961670 RepID=UPI001EE6B165|nr:uncharacterized protein LOC124309028 [Neodiprion virginianus]
MTKHKNNNKPRSSWITKGLMISCKTKETLYNLWNLDRSNNTLKQEYNSYCKLLNKLISLTKNEYENEMVKNIYKDSRKLWNYVNGKLGKNKNVSTEIDYIIRNEEIVTDNRDIADKFVDFFSNIGDELAKKIDKLQVNIEKNVKHNSNSIFLTPTDSFEIEKTILDLKDKSGGVDGISSKVLKIIANDISVPLEYIFNMCINRVIWPSALKKTDIIPIFKSGNKHLTTNYRPISLISNLAKIFEKIIFNRLYSFCISNILISNNQFGFVKNRGTSDALAITSNFIYNNIDNNLSTVLVFLDLAKAFDTVNHKILLDKLWRRGIRGIPHQLLTNYLTNREQCVKINNCTSETKMVKVGVPRGTILGPLLFIMYIDDIFDVLPPNALVAYADDTAVLCLGRNWTELNVTLNNWLNKLDIWLKVNKLSFNIDETTYITFGSYSDSVPKNYHLYINDRELRTYYLLLSEELKKKFYPGVTDNMSAMDRLEAYNTSKVITLTVTTRAVGFSTMHIFACLYEFNNVLMRGSIYQIYRVALAVFEAKIQFTQRGVSLIMNNEEDFKHQTFNEDWMQAAKAVVVLPDQLSTIINAVGKVTVYDATYVPKLAKDNFHEDTFIPQSELVVL